MRTKTLAGQRHTYGGLACRFMGLVCERSADRNPGYSHHIFAHPISRQIGFSGSGVSVIKEYPQDTFGMVQGNLFHST